jgi:hypothetical protein
MKSNLKDEPKEWRKSTLLPVVALVLIASLLHRRHHLSGQIWVGVLGVLALVTFAVMVKPRLFRAWHLLSMRAGSLVSRALGHVILLSFFFLVLTPLGWILQRCGKDMLGLKRNPRTKTYWHSAKEYGPLDRMF